ncbi:DUF2203 family protein [Terriglobus albidus]|uniref:DUF2203 family protein n=1 Tax=Terriglobus albidus TaxID=1592106 RepID=A0A5B9E6L9_9BACT|nr:DUF2203 domain-containing protein [Terriglobus albidus]QEE27658.1 DUF2203 family protein [Terriglobus albidus]
MRTFTLSEAQTMLPVLESLLKRAQTAARLAAQVDGELQDLSQRIFLYGGMHVDIAAVARRRGQREKAVQEAKDTLAEIDAIGVQVKDLDTGLLDFPFQLEDRVVLLCWKQGESAITHWHTMEDGFAGRKPLDERFTRGEKLQ